MSINLLSLPRNVFENVCIFLDDKSLIRTREVCKRAKDMVDGSILNVRDTEIRRFNVRQSMDEIQMIFSPENARDYSMWKLCLVNVFATLELSGLSVADDSVFFITTMDSAEAKLFLEYLKPISIRAVFNEIFNSLDNRDRLVARMCTDFFEGKRIRKLFIDHFKLGSEFIERVHVETVHCTLDDLSKDSIEFLMLLANRVSDINIYVDALNVTQSEPDTVSIVCEMLNEKCEMLTFDMRNSKLSIADVDKLIQFIHHLDKKVRFSSSVDADVMNVQLGVYRVEVESNYQFLLIEHLDQIE